VFDLKPKDESFFDMLEEGARLIFKGALFLEELMNNPQQARQISDDLYMILKAMQDLTEIVTERLDKSFVTPMDREDIGILSHRLQFLAGKLHGVADRIYLYNTGEPTVICRKLVMLLIEAIRQVNQAIGQIRKVQADKEEIISICRRITEMEAEADQIYRHGVALLFTEEKDPIALIKWKEIYEYLEDSLNHCEYLANIIENVVLKYA